MNVGVQTRGVTEVVRRLLQLGERVRDMRPASREIQDVLLGRQRRRFATNSEGAWPPLAAETLRLKAARGQSGGILRAKDHLYRSVTSAGGGDQVWEPRADSVTFGTRRAYAGYLFGGTRYMPARRPLGVTRDDVAEVCRILERHIGGEGWGG